MSLFDRSFRQSGFSIFLLYLTIDLILLNLIVSPLFSEGRKESRNDKIGEDRDEENRYDDTKSIRIALDRRLPRRILVDVLHKGQYFQDIFSEHSEPLKLQFGHVCENPNEWEQRFERNDLENNQHRGKVRFGNKNGDYGEHYWDFNH